MRHIPNIISLSRIFLVLVMMGSFENTPLFVILFMACGVTDVLDGYIARKTNTQSAFGARLDSIADFMMFATMAAFMVLRAGQQLVPFIPWVIAITVVRFANTFYAAYKYRFFGGLHTWGNKLTGFLLTITPIAYIVYPSNLLLWPVCLTGLLSAIEEGVIHLTTKELDLDRRSLAR